MGSLTSLCAACGLCCNGVLFHRVVLQPGDPTDGWAQRGLTIKRKKDQRFFRQPCTAFHKDHCAIYAERPTRCRAFECTVLIEHQQGTLTYEAALSRIQEAKHLELSLRALLLTHDGTSADKPLIKEAQQILQSAPMTDDEQSLAVLDQIRDAMHRLDTFLDRHFRRP